MRKAIPLNSPVQHGLRGARALALLWMLTAGLCGPQMLAAQTPAAAAPAATAHKAAHHPRKRPVAAKLQSPAPVAAVSAPAPVTPRAPEMPLWPANEKPTEAAVTWDSQGLRINAANSSLQQILKDVATATGAKVEGLETDERVFGVYGPGQARDVLSQLLLGTGYNVLLIGDQGQGTPRAIVLSARHAGGAQPASNSAPASASDEDADTDEQPQPQPPARTGFGPGGQSRNPRQPPRGPGQPGQPGQEPNNPQN